MKSMYNTNDQQPSNACVHAIDNPRVKRPFSVTLLTVLVLIIACIYLIRFAETLYLWNFILSLQTISPLYLAFTGLIWTVIGFPLSWGLWRGHPRAPKVTHLLALAYPLYYWLDRLLVASAAEVDSNWPFASAVTILLIILIFWVFSRSKVKNFFGVMHDDRSQNQ